MEAWKFSMNLEILWKYSMEHGIYVEIMQNFYGIFMEVGNNVEIVWN